MYKPFGIFVGLITLILGLLWLAADLGYLKIVVPWGAIVTVFASLALLCICIIGPCTYPVRER